MYPKHYLYLLLVMGSQPLFADSGSQTLENVTINGMRQNSAQPFAGNRKASDVLIDGAKFKSRPATLGEALAGEVGVHGNPFGGGASAPVIRGQEGVRVKILQNGSDVVDMSSLSPDHAVAADTLLAQKVELVRGASTLLYAAASPAGVVNIADHRIPEQMPQGQIEGEAAVRRDTAANEKAFNGGITLGIGNHVAVRAEGLLRRAENYHVPSIKLGEELDYLPDSHNRSRVGTLGASWIGSTGYLGLSYSMRRDKYGLPGHNHMLDTTSVHIFNQAADPSRPQRVYLNIYPHLMDDSDLDYAHEHGLMGHDHTPEHSHDNPYGHHHDHSSSGPWVDMASKRLDLRGEWRMPLTGIDKIKLALSHARYHHDEIHDGKFYVSSGEAAGIVQRLEQEAARLKGTPESIFDSRGLNGRIELYHRPLYGWQGVLGAQYTRVRSKAELTPRSGFPAGVMSYWRRRLLPEHTERRFSLFGLERLRYRNLSLELAARWERQSLPVHYDRKLLAREFVIRDPATQTPYAVPDLKPRKENAFSYSGSLLWDIRPDSRLSFTVSHNERIPAPMELYYHGKHLATNSYEFGNKNLQKERSDNFELGWKLDSEKWDIKLSVYHNRFRNYIHNETIRKIGNTQIRRYIQSQARFNGVEGEIGYYFSPEHKLTLFGDWVRGKLFRLPEVRGKEVFLDINPKNDDPDYNPEEDPDYPWCYDEEGLEQFCPPKSMGVQTIARPNRNAAKVPPARLGIRWEKSFRNNWSASLEYIHVFTQNKVSDSLFVREKTSEEKEMDQKAGIIGQNLTTEPIKEDKTRGHHLLNAGLSYTKRVGGAEYRWSLDAYNLLNQKVYVHNSHLPYVPRPGRNFVFGMNVSF